MPFLRLAHFQFVEQLLEAVAVFGEIDHVGRGAEDRHFRLLQRLGELERRLPAELHDDAVQRAVAALGVDDLQHVLRRERLEIEPVGGVVVGRHRLRIAVDHDGLVADLLEREGGMAAAVVELDALADTVGTAAEDDHLLLVRRRRFVGDHARERRLVGRIHIRRGRGEFGGAGIDALEYRADAERAALFHHLVGAGAGELAEPLVGKTFGLQPPERARRGGQTLGLDLGFRFHDGADLAQEPRIDAAGIVDQFVVGADAHGLRDGEQAVGRRRAKRGADRGLVIGVVAALGRVEAFDGDFVEPGEAGFQRAQCLLQGFLESAADRHGLAHRLHRRGQHVRRAGEFLEGEARDLGDDVIDGRLERGRRGAAGDVIGDLVERVADRELGGDLGDGEAGRFRGQRGGARHARIHLDDDQPPVGRIDRELHVGAAGLHPDFAQHRDRGVAHDLVFLVGERECRRDGDRIAGVHAHRIEVLDRADDDAIVLLVAHHLHLEFLPAEH